MTRTSALAAAVRVEPDTVDRQPADVARAVGDARGTVSLQLADGTSVPLPRSLVEVLRVSAGELADAHAVAVISSDASLTPSQVGSCWGCRGRSWFGFSTPARSPRRDCPGVGIAVFCSSMSSSFDLNANAGAGRQRMGSIVEAAEPPY